MCKKRLFYTVSLVILLFLVSCTFTEADYAYSLVFNPFTNKVVCPDANYVVCIEKDPSKDFVILNFGDVQPDATTLSDFTSNTISYLVKNFKPDLLTLTGDVLNDWRNNKGRETVENVGAFLNSFNIPWALAFGNHDHNSSNKISMDDQCDLYEGFSKCLFKRGPELGSTNSGESLKRGNYVVNIVERSNGGFKVVKSLIFLDTGDQKKYSASEYQGEQKFNSSGYDGLNDQQIEFYQNCMKSVQRYGKGGKVNSIVFLHIPITEYVYAIDSAMNNNYSFLTQSSSFLSESKKISYSDSFNAENWNEGYEDSFGIMHETIGCPSYDDHVFERISDSLDAIVCGHDHYNNFVVNYRGVQFCYTMKTGDGCLYYGPFMSGGTLISVASDGDVSISHGLYSSSN